MKSNFEKYAFLHHFLVFFLIVATVYAKNLLLLLVQNCCDMKNDI